MADKDPNLPPAAAPTGAALPAVDLAPPPQPSTVEAAPTASAAAPPVDPGAPQPSKQADHAVAAETPKADAVPEAKPSLLEEIGKTDEPKPSEAKPDAKPDEKTPEKPAENKEEKPGEKKPDEKKPDAEPEEKAAEAKPTEPAKLAPINYEYKLPDDIKMDDALKTRTHEAFDAFRSDPAKGVQGLIDLHHETMRNYAEHLAREQHRIFAETRDSWRKEVMADPELGGAGHQTAMGAIARMRDLAVPEKECASFNDMLRITGAGDHPAFLRALHNFARFFDEPALPPPNARPTADNGQRRPGRMKDLYTTPKN